MSRQPKRSEVPVGQTWNLDDIFPTKEAWEAEFNQVAGMISTVANFKGMLGEGAKTLLECLEAQEALLKRLAKVSAYASLHLAGDGTCPENQVMAGRTSALGTRIRAAASFIRSEALALPDGILEKYLSEEPGLEPFRITIEKMIESKPHLLHPDTEATLAALGEEMCIRDSLKEGYIDPGESIVVISTGNGLKDVVNAQRAAPPPIEVLPSVEELENNLKMKAPDLLKEE